MKMLVLNEMAYFMAKRRINLSGYFTTSQLVGVYSSVVERDFRIVEAKGPTPFTSNFFLFT